MSLVDDAASRPSHDGRELKQLFRLDARLRTCRPSHDGRELKHQQRRRQGRREVARRMTGVN